MFFKISFCAIDAVIMKENFQIAAERIWESENDDDGSRFGSGSGYNPLDCFKPPFSFSSLTLLLYTYT